MTVPAAATVGTYVLIPGAGGSRWYWHRVVPRLRALGHDVVAPDLPSSDPEAGLADYVDAVLGAIGERDELLVVGQSLGGLIAPLVCARRPAALLVLVAAMIPAPGETGAAWWRASGQADAAEAMARAQGRDPDAAFDPLEWFLHDVPPDVIAAGARHVREQSERPFADPWPLAVWPDVPTRVVACRDDRLFPLDFMRRLSRRRLGIEPDVVDSGHLPALAAPDDLVALLERYRRSLA